jgi:hypothetical protein
MPNKQFAGFLNTRPLWTKIQFGIRQFEFPEIDLTEFESQPIPGRIRLGHQMEHVFKQLMEESPRYEILVHNLPVKNEARTIGEIDFIVREINTGRLLHIELTYKLYIINTEITEPIHRLMGPNKRDMFFTKIEKVKHRQFPLLRSAKASRVLNGKGIDARKVEHQCCFKAQLFVPFGADSVNIRPLNKACISGYWLHFDDFDQDEFRAHTYYVPYKSEWVVAPHEEVRWQAHFETLMDINLRMLKENAPMVWMKKSEREFEKFFVVWW